MPSTEGIMKGKAPFGFGSDGVFGSSAFARNPAFMRGGMLMLSASADVALDAGAADESAEALCEGGSCNGNHGFTRGAP